MILNLIYPKRKRPTYHAIPLCMYVFFVSMYLCIYSAKLDSLNDTFFSTLMKINTFQIANFSLPTEKKYICSSYIFSSEIYSFIQTVVVGYKFIQFNRSWKLPKHIFQLWMKSRTNKIYASIIPQIFHQIFIVTIKVTHSIQPLIHNFRFLHFFIAVSVFSFRSNCIYTSEYLPIPI
jgi:hypothetical protein